MKIEIKPAAEIPNNPSKSRGGRPRIYPFGQMKVGKAFFLPADHPGAAKAPKSSGSRVHSAANSYAASTT